MGKMVLILNQFTQGDEPRFEAPVLYRSDAFEAIRRESMGVRKNRRITDEQILENIRLSITARLPNLIKS